MKKYNKFSHWPYPTKIPFI